MCNEESRKGCQRGVYIWRAAAEAATRCALPGALPVYCDVPDFALFWSDGVVVVSVDGVALDPLPDVLGVFVPEVPLLPLEPEESVPGMVLPVPDVLGELLDDELPLLL
ncbi:hypothetical protein [Noviherbaspirillum autotrophicum]|uniref:Uncharacterized protein n=1 Tax=Noviherbaspirillum autotrophicum TaxID=709839 RepID=A0A0C2BNF8_9BURK|nr:hypothetical protein [Noviherbaspirillum autotrophicum]KIF81564.1 hypothetical protein TSA66_13345 [Noviherbaspirillum autotrophicum]